MKKLACILSIIFLSFLAGPTIVAYIDDDADISFVFTASEEENSSENCLSFEYTIQETHSNHQSIHFLQQQQETIGYSYKEDYHQVFLDVLSPPPQNI